MHWVDRPLRTLRRYQLIDPHGSAGVLSDILFYLRARRIREKLAVITPLLGHATYLAQRYAHHY
jgi:hypothetical protein